MSRDMNSLPAVDREWSHKSDRSYTDEEIAIDMALDVLAKHAVEAGDRRMAGRVLAARALTGGGWYHLWDDCRDLLGTPLPSWDGTREHAFERGRILTDTAREFFAAGVHRRPRALLRAEARGVLFALRWLYRAGLLERRALSHAELAPWRRVTGAPETAHPNVLGPLPPTGASLN